MTSVIHAGPGPVASEPGSVSLIVRYLEWGPVVAGAIAAAALALVLHAFSLAIGLSVSSTAPTWRDASFALVLLSGLYLALAALASYGPGSNETHHAHHGHIRGRALPPWPLGAARCAVRRGRRCRRSRIQGDRGASAQRRRAQEGSVTRPQAWERKPTAEAVLRRLTEPRVRSVIEAHRRHCKNFCRSRDDPAAAN
jgi:ABC-type nickel/cobalt efflux system permease component RcnA